VKDAAADSDVPLVLDAVRGLLGEVDPARARAPIGPDQSLTRELALGSLERVELAMRLEQAAGVELGETVLADADTPRQIAAAIARARSHGATKHGTAVAPAAVRGDGARAGRRRADADRGAALAGRARPVSPAHPAPHR
jgi:acyl carrier protein